MRSIARAMTVLVLALAITVPGVSQASPAPWETGARAPGAPSGVKATAQVAAVKIAWKAPSSTGGKAITAYRVQRKQGSSWRQVASTNGAARSAVVTGLTNGTSYTFRVVAVNRDGAGTPSTSVSATPRTTPSAPRAVAADDRHESARVTWTRPSSNGGAAITGYVIQAAKGGGAFRTVGTAGASATSTTVTGLDNGTSYRFRVAARNPAGTGASSSPTPSLLLPSVVSVSVGSNHACAVTPGRTVVCWGRNNAGQLGNGETEESAPTAPTEVPGLTDVASVTAMADYTCAVKNDGTAWCWGTFIDGVLGSSPSEVQTAPIQVPNITDAVAVEGDQFGACALRSTGTIRCWGTNVGHLGVGTAFDILQVLGPDTDVVGITGEEGSIATQVTVGQDFTCVVMEGSFGNCWGSGFSGATGSTSDRRSAQNGAFPTSQISTVNDISSGFAHTCAINASGAVFCWGRDGSGQLGDGEANPSAADVLPQAVTDLVATDVSAGSATTCAIAADATVSCWGDLPGAGSTSPSPVAVSGSDGSRSIDAGGQSVCVVLTDGTPRCWGENQFGQLGNGGTTDSTTPVRPTGL